MTKKTAKNTWKEAFLSASAAARPANPPPITIADGVCGFLLAFSPYEPDMKTKYVLSQSKGNTGNKMFKYKMCSEVQV
jgi:hypothetical protein